MRDGKRQFEAPWFFRVFQSFLYCVHPTDNQNSTDPFRWLYSKRGTQKSCTSPGSEEVSPGIEFSSRTLHSDPGPPPKLPRLSHTSQARPLCSLDTPGSSPSPEHAIILRASATGRSLVLECSLLLPPMIRRSLLALQLERQLFLAFHSQKATFFPLFSHNILITPIKHSSRCITIK